jgi:hypothetical protein
MFKPGMTVLEADFTTARSEAGASEVVAVEELLPGFVSKLEVETVAVLETIDPARDGSNVTVSVNCAEAAFTKGAASVQFTEPPAPAGGVEQMNAGPVFCISETKVAPGGSASEIATESAASGPALATVIV